MNANKIAFINPSDLHPSLLSGVNAEIDRLGEDYPVLPGSRVTLEVCKTFKDDNQYHEMTGYGLTSWDSDRRAEIKITLNAKVYGAGEDSIELQRMLLGDLENQYHGSMTNPVFPLTHEYGHALERMIRNGKQPLWAKAFGPIVDYFESHGDVVQDYRMGFIFGYNVPETVPVFNTRYAAESGPEFFAETFALLHWGNEREKASTPCRLMRDLLKVVYPESAQERSS